MVQTDFFLGCYLRETLVFLVNCLEAEPYRLPRLSLSDLTLSLSILSGQVEPDIDEIDSCLMIVDLLFWNSERVSDLRIC